MRIYSRTALSLVADAVHFCPDGQLVEAGYGQTEEQTDPAIQNHEGVAECLFYLLGRARRAAGSGTPQWAVIG